MDTLTYRSWQKQGEAKSCLSKGPEINISTFLGARKTLCLLRNTPRGLKVRGQCQAIKSLASLRCLCIKIHLGREVCAYLEGIPETNYPGKEKWDDWPEGRQRPWKLPPYKGFKHPKGSALSLSLPMHLSICIFTFPISFLLLSLPLPFCLNSFLTRQARNGDPGPSFWPLWSLVRICSSDCCHNPGLIPGQGTKVLLVATACCCLLRAAIYCYVQLKSLLLEDLKSQPLSPQSSQFLPIDKNLHSFQLLSI